MADKTEQKDLTEQESEPVAPEVAEGSEPVAPEVAEAPAPSTAYPMDEVFRVNHLLQIEDLDRTQQLKQAVSNFLIFT